MDQQEFGSLMKSVFFFSLQQRMGKKRGLEIPRAFKDFFLSIVDLPLMFDVEHRRTDIDDPKDRRSLDNDIEVDPSV
jgi:hypothetical protein